MKLKINFLVDVSSFQTESWESIHAILDGLGHRADSTVKIYCPTELASTLPLHSMGFSSDEILTEASDLSSIDVFLSASSYPQQLSQYPRILSLALLCGAEKYCGEEKESLSPVQFRYWKPYDFCLCLDRMLLEPSALRLLEIDPRRAVPLEGPSGALSDPETLRRFVASDSMDRLQQVLLRRDEQPLVTIVTITYNLIENGRRESIQACIRSVAAQTYPNIEHIIIDGASTDGTLELLAPFESKHTIQVFSEKDDGIYDAMNKGLARAGGTYILYLNSDDSFCSPDAIGDLVTQIQKFQSDYGFADAELVGADGVRYPWVGDVNLLPYTSSYCHQTLLARTELLRSMGGFDTAYRLASDVDLRLRLYKERYPFCTVHKTIVSYSMDGVSAAKADEVHDEYMLSFYRHFGRELGITHSECKTLLEYKFLTCLPLTQQIGLLEKLSVRFSIESSVMYMLQMAQKQATQQTQQSTALADAQVHSSQVKAAMKERIKRYGHVRSVYLNGGRLKVFLLFGCIPFYVKKISD